MDIEVDFVPKHGDRIRHRLPSGHISTYVFIVCPDCSNGRWVPKNAVERPGYTSCCRKCSLVLMKKRGWTTLRMGDRMEIDKPKEVTQ